MKHYCNYGILKIEDDSGNDGIRRILFLKNTFTIILLCHLILGSKAFEVYFENDEWYRIRDARNFSEI